MANERFVLEVEIRQNSNDITTDGDPSGITGVTVVENTFPSKVALHRMTNIRVYIDDDHDEAIDVDVAHTHLADDDYSGESTKSTVSLTSGQDQGNVTLDGPLGRLRVIIKASAAGSAPTAGSMRIEVLGTS